MCIEGVESGWSRSSALGDDQKAHAGICMAVVHTADPIPQGFRPRKSTHSTVVGRT